MVVVVILCCFHSCRVALICIYKTSPTSFSACFAFLVWQQYNFQQLCPSHTWVMRVTRSIPLSSYFFFYVCIVESLFGVTNAPKILGGRFFSKIALSIEHELATSTGLTISKLRNLLFSDLCKSCRNTNCSVYLMEKFNYSSIVPTRHR